jgi:hypothetical protein
VLTKVFKKSQLQVTNVNKHTLSPCGKAKQDTAKLKKSGFSTEDFLQLPPAET